MAIKEHQLWDLFDIVWKKYVEPMAKLCLDLSQGRIHEQGLCERLRSIQRVPKIDESSKTYMWLGRAFVEQTNPNVLMFPLHDNLHRRSVMLADDFRAKLSEAVDPLNFDCARDIAELFAPRFQELRVRSLKAEVELAWKLAKADQLGADAKSSNLQASELIHTAEVAPWDKLVIELNEGTAQSAAITWDDTRYTVDGETARAVQAMKRAKGQPVGLGSTRKSYDQTWFMCSALRRMQLFSVLPGSRRRRCCFLGTCMCSCRHSRSTRL